MDAAIVTALIAACAAVVGGIVSGVFSLVLQKSKHKDEKADERTEWEQHVDGCLDSDKRSIRRLEKSAEDASEMDKLLLRGLMLITAHLVDRNHTKELQQYAEEVNKTLIERL